LSSLNAGYDHIFVHLKETITQSRDFSQQQQMRVNMVASAQFKVHATNLQILTSAKNKSGYARLQ
jgi:hypothetical protein